MRLMNKFCFLSALLFSGLGLPSAAYAAGQESKYVICYVIYTSGSGRPTDVTEVAKVTMPVFDGESTYNIPFWLGDSFTAKLSEEGVARYKEGCTAADSSSEVIKRFASIESMSGVSGRLKNKIEADIFWPEMLDYHFKNSVGLTSRKIPRSTGSYVAAP